LKLILFLVAILICLSVVISVYLFNFPKNLIFTGSIFLFVLFFYKKEFILWVFILIGIFFYPIRNFSFRVLGILILPSDILAIFANFLGFIFLTTKSHKNNSMNFRIPTKVFSITIFFITLIILSTLIGLYNGNYPKSVLRETKLIIYYSLIPIFCVLMLRENIKIERVFIITLIFSSLGSLYDLYCRLFDIYTISGFAGGLEGYRTVAETPVGTIVRDYGWISTFPYQVFAFLIAIVLFLNFKNLLIKIFALLLGMLNLITNFLTVTRGFMVAIFLGCLTILLLELMKKRLKLGAIFRGFVIGLLIFAFLYLSTLLLPSTKGAFYRLTTVFSDKYAGRGDIENMNIRLKSLELGIKTALSFPFGKGFGVLSETGKELQSEKRLLSLLYHNSLGYIFYSFGLIGTLGILFLFFSLLLKLTFLYPKVDVADKINLSLVISNFIALLSMSFTSANFLFTIECVLPFSIFLFASIGYYLQIDKRRDAEHLNKDRNS